MQQRLHPVQVEYTYHLGSRTDLEWDFPVSLEDADLEDVLDRLSSPPEYIERIAPLSFHLGPEVINGRNPSDAFAKFLRHFQRMLQMVSGVLRQMSRDRFGEKGPVAFLGLALCPEVIRRQIESDYENADNSYNRLVELIRKGNICPVVTAPFHPLLPLLGDFELRLLIRMALVFYWPLLKLYNRAVRKLLQEDLFTLVFWLPEGAISRRALEILHTEFSRQCDAAEIPRRHLIVLLETGQAREREQDILMKRWHAIRPTTATRDHVSLVFRDRAFTEWVVEGHPSVKKLLDRTIAKVDAALREAGIDYLWSHFESLESLLATPKTAINFQQKLIKLTELGYQPLSPDAFVRRKILEIYSRDAEEPRRCSPLDNTAMNGWPEDPNSLARWEGVIRDEEGRSVAIAPCRPYVRRNGKDSQQEVRGSQCWKPALTAAFAACHRAVVGDSKTFLGGMLQLLRELTPHERIPVQRRNVEEFLLECSKIHWREHFIQTSLAEADIQVYEFARDCLLRDCAEDAEITEERACVAGMAARAVLLAFEAQRSTSLAPENLDQRGVYESVAMMTLAFVHAVQAFLWMEKPEEANALLDVLEKELFDFESAFERCNLAELGVTKKEWRETLQSEIEESSLNVVARAARRVAARHFRRMGFKERFARDDEFLPSAVGHLWSMEVHHANFQWENEAFCGLAEE